MGPSPSSCWQRGTWHPQPLRWERGGNFSPVSEPPGAGEVKPSSAKPVQLCAGAACGFSPKRGKFPPRRPAPSARWGGSRGKPLAGTGLEGSSPPPPEILLGRGSLPFHSILPLAGITCWGLSAELPPGLPSTSSLRFSLVRARELL